MYEEGNKRISLNWGSLIIKLIVLAIIVFLAGWLYMKITNGKSSGSNSTLAKDTNSFVNNINTMKNTAFEYFTKSKLPTKIGGTEKLTLTQMIDQKLLIDFTNGGKDCDTDGSYIQTTKTADGNYALKVSLTCGKKSDFIITTIENSETCTGNSCNNNNNSNNENNNTNSDVVVDDKTNNNNNNSNSNNNSSNSNNNTTVKEVIKYVPAPPTTTKTTVTTTVTIKCKYINGRCTSCCSTSCCPSSCTNNSDDKKKVRYYEYVKWSDWQEGYSNEKNAENKEKTITTYNYCKENTRSYYTMAYITDNCDARSYTYEFQLANLPSNATDITIKNKSYFDSSLTDYQAYINYRNNQYMSGNSGNKKIVINDVNAFRNSSLKSNNFTFSISNPYYKTDGYKTSVTINYKNSNNVNAYYESNLNRNIYFMPVKFDVSYITADSCKKDLSSNSFKYSGYIKKDQETTTSWIHRTPEYKWSTETSLDGYTRTGNYEDR